MGCHDTDLTDVFQGRYFECIIGSVIQEGAIAQNVFDKTYLASSWNSEGETNRAGAIDDVCILDHRLGCLIHDVVDTGRHGVFVNLGLGVSICLKAAVPVKVVIGKVQDGA